jgi:hypothetical protein
MPRDPLQTLLELFNHAMRQHPELVPRIESLAAQLISNRYADDVSFGSAEWLIKTERKFGGFVTNVERRTVSQHDPRSAEDIRTGGMTGGDRMLHHAYAMHYASHLKKFIPKRLETLTIVEVGILKGTGLALWSELFPASDILGLDIDLSHFEENRKNLISRGAFKRNSPELYSFDQFTDNRSLISKLLNGRKIDILIDDGFHSNETILNTARDFYEFLAEDFVYFVEDNNQVANSLRTLFPNRFVSSYGQLTVIDTIEI